MAHLCLGARNRLRDDWESVDVAQEAALRICRSSTEFRGMTEAQFLAWARTVVRSVVTDAGRRRAAAKRDAERLGASEGEWVLGDAHATTPTPSQVAMGAEAAEKFLSALARLPEHESELIVLRKLCGCTFEEIADELDTGTAARARARLARALGNLAKELDL
ncbi:RNA polymerase sigma factor [Planctomycetes bacterium Pla86]|uniref:RNA polymerase sigma factor n=2 Tax=Engelhardtia mirabilis TaxID=2528011 RepID=A0A518BNU7_9BACT|nr:RNA polymerase sigma factor [Planctomycetes bacterium Pla133]QDV02982.1 RNA polymerase sigma factor [Planctomycetes bacterium Pla86]